MKEAPTKNLPPKIHGTSSGGTPIKNNSNNNFGRVATSDEILSTLLRINNFDSISSIKDDSLDIDLSACVTISSDPSGMINGNSLSSHDFWRVLDESAQNPGQIDNANSNDNTTCGSSAVNASNFIDNATAKNEGSLPFLVKSEHVSSFSGTFLRPEPPMFLAISPLKKLTKTSLPAEHLDRYQRKPITKSKTAIPADQPLTTERKKPKIVTAAMALLVKQEPPEQLLADDEDSNKNDYSDNNSDELSTMISKHSSFNMFMEPHEKIANSNSEPVGQQKAAAPLITSIPGGTDVQVVEVLTVEEPRIPTLEPIFKCEDCGGLILHGLHSYSLHEALSHKILFKCNECQKDFDNETALKKHSKTHRTVESRKDAMIKCPDCGKCLKHGSMWMHRKIHSDNKKYGCDICGQKFVQKINLTHHSHVHTSEKPYECPECQKRFQERSHLQRHQKYHAQTRSYRCEKCGKMYKTERCLKVHNLVHLEQRPFACNVCDKSFISNSKLKQHSNIHTGERPFKCNYCPRDFTNFPNWLKHTRRRHKVDHKTGEHLENIPSYCSKKSTKGAATKVEKVTPTTSTIEPKNEQPSTILDTGSVIESKAAPPTVVKSQTKRKKKLAPPPLEPLPSVTVDASFSTDLTVAAHGQHHHQEPLPIASNPPVAVKLVKNKRERKQQTPKQVQKPATLAVIKKEIIDCIELTELEDNSDANPASTNFPDLHCLSITSAEELIMEQALEMEECGLYDAPRTSAVLDTDNAVSAESAAAQHFHIKKEYIDIKEEFEAANNRVMSSSLESSPYSSPASIEFSNANVVPASTVSATKTASSSSFYMPSYRLDTGSIVSNMNANILSTSTPTTSTRTSITSNGLSIQQMPTQLLQQEQQRTAPLPSAQALLNHLYVPITMSMPLLMQPQLCTSEQVLPSVDTLLFTHANSHFFRGKNAAQAAAYHNL